MGLFKSFLNFRYRCYKKHKLTCLLYSSAGAQNACMIQKALNVDTSISFWIKGCCFVGFKLEENSLKMVLRLTGDLKNTTNGEKKNIQKLVG